MRSPHIGLLLALLAMPLAAQHAHPHVPSKHSHDQVRRRHLHFGTVDIPVAMAGTVHLPSGNGTTALASPLLKLVPDANAGCATYYIKDGGVAEGHEATWKILPPAAHTLSFDLVHTWNSAHRIRVILDPVPSPATGDYVVMGRTFRSPDIYWGGRIEIPAHVPEGTYVATTPTWTTLGPVTGTPVNGFVISEDFCHQGVTYGISAEYSTFQVSVVIQRTRQPLTVRTLANMHFGALLPGGRTGTVTLAPENPPRRTGHQVTLAHASPAPSPGIFTVLGNAGATVDYLLPEAATLTGPGGASMTVDAFTANVENAAGTIPPENGGSGAFRIGMGSSTSRLVTFLVGARLTVAPGQTPGTYTGTYPLNFAYR